MNFKAVAFLFGLIIPIAHAQQPFTTNKPVICDSTKAMIEKMSGPDWKEEPIWVGSDDQSKYVLMHNEKTRSWTMIQFNGDIACMIGSGEKGRLLRPGGRVIRS